MAHRSSNRRRNLWVISLLDVQPTDSVFEVGFGPGIGIKEASRLAVRGRVFGIDHSEVMVRQATKRNASAVRSGRVVLQRGSAEDPPVYEVPMDKIVSVNSMGFWRDPVDRLRVLHGRLRPGGQIAIASQPRCPGATRGTSMRAAHEIEDALHSAGFSRTRVETLDLKPPAVCVIGDA
jgi:SAM-dependent methyltransferase